MIQNKLSIIIVTWNTAEATHKCVRTIKKFIKKIDYEIIVVDNASSDNTVPLLKKISGLKIVENDKNFGFSHACNQGTKVSSGNLLFFLNSDMELIDSSLEKMVSFFNKNKSIGAIGPQFLNPDLTPQASAFPPQTIFNAIKEFWFGIPSYSKYLPTLDRTVSVWAISGGAILMRKNFFEKIGGWNEKYFFYFEDLDLCRTIHKHHKKIFFYPKCKIIHYHGLSGRKLKDSQDQWRRLIPGSIKYHGFIGHYLIFIVMWLSQKFKIIFNKK